MKIDRSLIQKYNQSGPRYTSYPPATFFSSDFDNIAFEQQVIESNSLEPNSISLYIHIPFCQKLCHFCGCNSVRIPQQNIVKNYVEALCIEIKKTSSLLDKTRKVTQIHWGGGTPHSIQMDDIAKIMDVISDNFIIHENAEIAMECNPAYTDMDFFSNLKKNGFNRVSLGIQDFDANVLKIVNRDVSLLPYNQLIDYIKSLGLSLNIDLIYGLPGQTIESFNENINKVILFNPDRLVTFSYAHVPWVKKAQLVIEKYQLPNADEKLTMLENANEKLLRSGYISIGFDHFAKPDDDLAKSLDSKTLHRNFQGYCSKNTTGQVYAFGVSGISQLTNSYFQNTKNIEQYIDALQSNNFAVEKGYILDKTDIVVREVITELMCNLFVDFSQIARFYNITLNELYEIFHFDSSNINDFVNDEFLNFNDDKLTVLSKGAFFLRNIAMVFDPKLKQMNAIYSKTI